MTRSVSEAAKLKAINDLCAALREVGAIKPSDLLRSLPKAESDPDDRAALAAAERLIFLENLDAIADALDAFGVPTEHQAALRRLFHAILNVHAGRRFHAFQGPAGPNETPTDALFKRAFVAAAVSALMKSGMTGEEAHRHAAQRMRASAATDFGCQAREEIDAAMIKNWRDRFGRERRRSTTASAYGRLMQKVERTKSTQGLRSLAEALFDDAILEADPGRYAS
jgi:hypothetical protein